MAPSLEIQQTVSLISLKAACRDIGFELATRRHEVIVGSLLSRDRTADHYIIEGMQKVEGKHKITFYRPEGVEIPQDILNLPKEKFEVTRKELKGDRNINALAEGKAMLVIGGQSGTARAGFAAFALKRPVLALPRFGGAGKEIWDAVSVRYGQALTLKTLNIIASEWSEASASAVVSALEELGRNNPFDEGIKRPQIFLTVCSILAVLSWVAIFSFGSEFENPASLYLLFFLAIGLASVIGTMARTFVNVYFDVIEVYSPRRLLSDFVLGIILAFGFFLILQVSGVLLTGRN